MRIKIEYSTSLHESLCLAISPRLSSSSTILWSLCLSSLLSGVHEEEAHSLDDIRFSSSLARRIELTRFAPRSLRELVSPLASLDDKDQCHNGTLPPR